jgi:hypothetical protein
MNPTGEHDPPRDQAQPPGEDGTGQPPDVLDYADPDTPADRAGDFADELDGLRIRQLSALRRGAYRARSYALIGVGACAVTGIQLLIMTVTHVRARGWGMYPTGYVLGACVAVMLASHFGRRVMELHREIKTPAPLPPAPAEPDFSRLSDGSQQWKNLEDIR